MYAPSRESRQKSGSQSSSLLLPKIQACTPAHVRASLLTPTPPLPMKTKDNH